MATAPNGKQFTIQCNSHFENASGTYSFGVPDFPTCVDTCSTLSYAKYVEYDRDNGNICLCYSQADVTRIEYVSTISEDIAILVTS